MPRVSVIIPTFNYSQFVTQAVDSVLAQTYQDYEVIVVDDGSTDDTKVRLQPYIDHGQIQYIFQANQGLPGARNTGIRASQGELIAFIDSDDIWTPTKLALQVPKFDNDRVGIVYGDTLKFYDQHVSRATSFAGIAPARGEVTCTLLQRTFPPMPTVMVRREAFEKVGYFDAPLQSPGEDIDLWLRLSLDYEFDYVDQVVAYYRVHATSISASTAKVALRRLFVLERFIQNHRAELEQQCSVELLNQVIFEAKGDVGKYLLGTGQSAEGRKYLAQARSLQPSIRLQIFAMMSWVPGMMPALYRWRINQLRQQQFRMVTPREQLLLGT